MNTEAPDQTPIDTVTLKGVYSPISTTQELSTTDVDQVISDARKKANYLRKYSIDERIRELEKVISYILVHKEAILDRVIAEAKKCRTDAIIAEVLGVIDCLNWYINNAKSILADKKVATPITLLGKKSKIYHEPHGVVFIIAPWNYPVHTAITSIAGAFVAGNSVIYKSSEITPIRGLIEEIISASPLLTNATQVIYGSGITAERVIAKRPDKIYFTGSTRTGKKIMAQASQMIIPLDLELGGKDPMIVFDDVPIDRPVAAAVWGALTHSGQSCSAVERLYVHENIYDDFLEKLKEAFEKLVIKPRDNGEADIGCLTVDFQMKIVEKQVEDARQKGATIVCGGRIIDQKNLIFSPTIITGVNNSMTVLNEETFGPVLPVMTFRTEEEVIALANDCEYGLCASIFSKDLDRADRVARALEVGGISINNVNMSEGNPGLSFGGTKYSGWGRARGAEGLLGYTRSKNILVDKASNKIEANWYPYTERKYRLFEKFLHALYQKSPIKLAKVIFWGLSLEIFSQQKRK